MPEPTTQGTQEATQAAKEQGTQQEQQDQTQQNGATPPVFDNWLAEQDEPIKAMIGERFKALENTVSATRDERDNFKDELKGLRDKAEKGSELETKLTATIEQLEAAEKKAAFFEEANKAGIECRNPKAAYALAMASDLFTRTGAPDWSAIKTEAPELFGKPAVPSHGGNGTQENLEAQDMNAAIRRMAGRPT